MFRSVICSAYMALGLSLCCLSCACPGIDSSGDDDNGGAMDLCSTCLTTESCVAALGMGWACRSGCCAEVAEGASTTTTTTAATTSTATTTSIASSTTTTSVGTTTSTTSTTIPLSIHATNAFNDAIDLAIALDADGRPIEILGGWTLLTGRWDELVEDPSELAVAQSIPLVFSSGLSTPTSEVYTFALEAIQGVLRRSTIDSSASVEMEISGDMADATDLLDRVHGVTPPATCPDDYPPLIFGEVLRERDCWTGIAGDPLEFDPDLNAWQIPIWACVQVEFFHSDPDCDWDVAALYVYREQFNRWDTVPQFEPEPGNCSWFESDGNGLAVAFTAGDSEGGLTDENRFRFVAACGTESNERVVRAFHFPTALDRIAEEMGRRGRLAEEVYYNDSGGAISGGYSDSLAELIAYDHRLDDEPEVTFTFGACNSSGYTFQTRHLHGTQVYEWTD